MNVHQYILQCIYNISRTSLSYVYYLHVFKCIKLDGAIKMAEAAISGLIWDIAGESLREGLSCPICLELYKKPKALQCLHTFCEECIQSNIDSCCRKGSQKSILCPECRQITKAPKQYPSNEWAKHLPTNWPVSHFIGTIGNMGVSGDGHDGTKRAINTADLEECERIQLCNKHPEKQFKFYCQDHGEIICEVCRDTLHANGCLTVAIESIANTDVIHSNAIILQSEIAKVQLELDNTIETMKTNIECVVGTIDELNLHLIRVWADVKLLIHQLHQDISKDKVKDEHKTKFTQQQKSKISECVNLQKAIQSVKAEMDVIEENGTPSQRFIAAVKWRTHISMVREAVHDCVTSARCTEVRHMGIDAFDSVVKRRDELKSIKDLGVKEPN